MDYTGRYQTIILAVGDATLAASGSVIDSSASQAAIYGVFEVGTFDNAGYVHTTGSNDAGIEFGVYQGTLSNSGRILATGSHSAGVVMDGGTLDNGTGGTIEATGIDSFGAVTNSALLNEGTIAASGSAGIGIGLGQEEADNAKGGVIIGVVAGIDTEGSVTNAGTIEATDGIAVSTEFDGGVENTGTIEGLGDSGFGISLLGHSQIDNLAGGTIVAENAGIETYGTAVYNDGLIEATGSDGVGIVMHDSKYGPIHLVNLAGGKIVGGDHGAGVIDGYGTINNAGVIEGYVGVVVESGELVDSGTIVSVEGRDAVLFETPGGFLKLHPGAMIDGAVYGDQTWLFLGRGAGQGTLHGLGRRLTGINYLTITEGADWRLTGLNEVAGAFENAGTLVVAGTVSTDDQIDNAGFLKIAGGTVVVGAIAGDGDIEIAGDGTLSLSHGYLYGSVEFDSAAGMIALAAPAIFTDIGGFEFGDTIDLSHFAVTAQDSLVLSDGELRIEDAGYALVSLGIAAIAPGTALSLVLDGDGGTDIVGVPIGLGNLVNWLPQVELAALDSSIESIAALMPAPKGAAAGAIDVFTPATLAPPSGLATFDTVPQAGDLNIENGEPKTAGETIALSGDTQGIVLTGNADATLIGDATVSLELLAGNAGNDTIAGGGGAGWIFSGTGDNQLRTGAGNMTVVSGGSDHIVTGAGTDLVDAYGSATVRAGSGSTTFVDLGAAGGSDRVRGGTGTTVMRSGLDRDTFIGGAGTSDMIDTGHGQVAFEFVRGLGGDDVVSGFDAADGDYILVRPNSFGAKSILGHLTVTGGSSFVALGDGTKIELVGVTDLSTADFHS